LLPLRVLPGCEKIGVDRERFGEIVSSRWLLTIIVLVLSRAPLSAAKDIALVSNKGNDLQTIAMADLVKVCKGTMNRWSDGKPVTLVILDPASPEMKIVVQKVYDSTPEQVKTVISAANHGRANHPAIIVVNSNEALVQKVESTPGSVGLVDVYSITGGVAVLKVGGKLPLEPGYPLHGN